MEQQPRNESRAATVREGGAESWTEAGEFIDRPDQLPVSAGSRTPAPSGSKSGSRDTFGSPSERAAADRSSIAATTPGPGVGGSTPPTASAGRTTDRVETSSPGGADFSSSAAPAGLGSNTPIGAEPDSFRAWDARQPDPGTAFDATTRMPGYASLGSMALAATVGGLSYAWWRRRQARNTRSARLKAAALAAVAATGADLPRLLGRDIPRIVGQTAAQSKSAWVPFALLPIALWLRQRGKDGERASDQLLAQLHLEKRSQRLARKGADLFEKRGRQMIHEYDPLRDDDSGWGWTPWIVGGVAVGGAYLAYRQGLLGEITSNVAGSQSPQTLVREVMTKAVETTAPDASVSDVARRMRDLDVGSLPVCDGTRLIGMVTDRDLSIRATAEGKDPNATRVRDVMSPEVAWVFDDEPAAMAASVMRSRQIRRLPVLDRDDRLVGVVALGDLATDLGDDRLKGATLEEISQPTGGGRR